MDSLFSLFDPADSVARPRKERRRGRQETSIVPSPSSTPSQDRQHTEDRASPTKTQSGEESSFLNEPQFSRHVLDRDVSYLDSYIDIYHAGQRGREHPQPTEKKKKNSRHKSRRKKSPPGDQIPDKCWKPDNLFYPERCQRGAQWNNAKSGWARKASVGKNVNDLSGGSKDVEADYGSRCKRKTEPFSALQADGDLSNMWSTPVRTVLDTLDNATLQEELYLADEVGSESDGRTDDEQPSDSSEPEDSGDEVYGSLPPEPQLGNVEYKLQLVCPSHKRFQHLVTQLKWRLRSGGGRAVYVLGVRDCGALRGLRARPLRASLRTLQRMAAALRAEVRHVSARQLAPGRCVAQACLSKLADPQQSVELRVAVMGANEAGKSTLVGVLTQGELDNGRGSARLNMFRHLHEVRSGRTSSLSHEILGFDAQGNVVNYGCSELMTAERIGERSAKLVSFLDLAGHSKYQRTTVHGLTGYCPHHAMLLISATAGISRMTEEHLGLLLALDLPFFIVVTKIELAPARLSALLRHLREILAAAGCRMIPRLISNEQQARAFVLPAPTPLDALDKDGHSPFEDRSGACVAVFPVSSVSGSGLSALHSYLLALEPPSSGERAAGAGEEESCEFQIDEIFRLGSGEAVVGGLLAAGVLREGDRMLVGPLDSGDFVPTAVRSVYRNRVPCGSVTAGQSASLGLGVGPALRPGMVLVTVPGRHRSNIELERHNLKEIELSNDLITKEIESKLNLIDVNLNSVVKECNIKVKDENANRIDKDYLNEKEQGVNIADDKWDKKAYKAKNNNLLQDIANVESSLVKNDKVIEDNTFTDDLSEEVTNSCDEILLEDPNNPRGCQYFQATVRLLRHCATEICPGFQATVYIGNVRQTAVIQGIMTRSGKLTGGQTASVMFHFVRQPEYVRAGRKMLFRAGLETTGVGRVAQVFPMDPTP